MAEPYPIVFDVARPERFERVHVVLRIAILILLSLLGGAFGWLLGLIYVALPIVAALFVSSKGPDRFLAEDAPRLTGWLRWLMAFYAYLSLLTDRFPLERPGDIVRFEVRPAGSPTVGSALLRLIYSIPSAIVLGLLGIISGFVWLIGAILVLINQDYPAGMYGFQRGILRWLARLLGYHASLVDHYPPFSIDTGAQAA